jgi:hypothetical protein
LKRHTQSKLKNKALKEGRAAHGIHEPPDLAFWDRRCCETHFAYGKIENMPVCAIADKFMLEWCIDN